MFDLLFFCCIVLNSLHFYYFRNPYTQNIVFHSRKYKMFIIKKLGQNTEITFLNESFPGILNTLDIY